MQQALGPYGAQAEYYVDIPGLQECLPNQYQALEVDKRRDYLLRVADHLGLGVAGRRGKMGEEYERLRALIRFYSQHPPEKWCVCEHVSHEVPEKDHKVSCASRKELKRQRVELERVEWEVLEEVEREEREEVERRQAIDKRVTFARQLALNSTHFEADVAKLISDANLAHMAGVIAAELERRRIAHSTA